MKFIIVCLVFSLFTATAEARGNRSESIFALPHGDVHFYYYPRKFEKSTARTDGKNVEVCLDWRTVSVFWRECTRWSTPQEYLERRWRGSLGKIKHTRTEISARDDGSTLIKVFYETRQ